MLDARAREAKLAPARQAARDLARREGVESVYLSGSLVAGLGTSLSDVDVFLIAENEGSARPEQLMVDGQRIDVEVRTPADLDELVRMFSTVSGTRRSQDALFKADQRFDDVVRLLYSESVQAGPAYTAASAALGGHRDRIRRAILAFRQLRCINASEDAAGFLRDGEIDGALLVTHAMLLEAIELYLAGCGDLYLGPKWIWQKLARSGGGLVPQQRLRALLHHVPEDPRRQAEFVRARLRAVQALMLAALVGGWDTPDAATWPHWGTDEAQVHRNHEWLPLRMDDGTFLIYIDERQLKASTDALTLWGACDGSRPMSAVAAEYAAAQGLAPDAEAKEAVDTADYLAAQVRKGLLLEPAAEG